MLWFQRPGAYPQANDTPVAIPDKTSTIHIPVSGDLAVFEAILNREIPRRLVTIDEPEKICFATKSKLLPDISCKLVGHIDRGPIRLGGSGETITLTMPVNTMIQARNIGGIIKRETATGSMTVTMRARLGLQRDWQPTAKVDIDYQWGEEIGIEALGQRITFGSRVDLEIRKIAGQIEKRLPKLIGQLEARQKAEQIWAAGFTVERAKTDPGIWVRFTPQRIGFAGYRVSERQLIVDLAAEAQNETIFGARPAKPEVTPLPDLMETLPPKGVDVHVPVHIPYSVLQEPLETALGFGEFRTVALANGMETEARFNDVQFFATAKGRLAIGFDLTIISPLPWQDRIEGNVWIVGRPELDPDNKVLSVSDLSVISRTDSTIFNAVTGAIAAEVIDDELIAKIRYDFSPEYDEGLEKADAWLRAQPLEGFVFSGALKSADIDEVHPSPDGFVILARATGDAQMVYRPDEAARLVARRRAERAERKSAAKTR